MPIPLTVYYGYTIFYKVLIQVCLPDFILVYCLCGIIVVSHFQSTVQHIGQAKCPCVFGELTFASFRLRVELRALVADAWRCLVHYLVVVLDYLSHKYESFYYNDLFAIPYKLVQMPTGYSAKAGCKVIILTF